MSLSKGQGAIGGITAIVACFAIFLPWNSVLSRVIYDQGREITGNSAAAADIPQIQSDISALKTDSAVNSALLKEISRQRGIDVLSIESRVRDNTSTTTPQ